MNVPLSLNESATFTKTISESDVYLFAGITGDQARNHVDEEYMKKSAFGRRIVHGALLVGYVDSFHLAPRLGLASEHAFHDSRHAKQ